MTDTGKTQEVKPEENVVYRISGTTFQTVENSVFHCICDLISKKIGTADFNKAVTDFMSLAKNFIASDWKNVEVNLSTWGITGGVKLQDKFFTLGKIGEALLSGCEAYKMSLAFFAEFSVSDIPSSDKTFKVDLSKLEKIIVQNEVKNPE